MFTILKLERNPPKVALSTRMEKTFIPMMNIYGERGSPCLRLLELLKNPVGLSFINIEKDAVEMHLVIHLTHLAPNPIFEVS